MIESATAVCVEGTLGTFRGLDFGPENAEREKLRSYFEFAAHQGGDPLLFYFDLQLVPYPLNFIPIAPFFSG